MAWLIFAPRLHVVNYPLYGTKSLEANYRVAEKHLLELYRRHGKLRLAGWSQGAVHALRFTLEHPEMVERLVPIAGPMGGSWAAYFFPWVPAARDMRPDSTMGNALAAELAAKARSLPYTVALIAAQ